MNEKARHAFSSLLAGLVVLLMVLGTVRLIESRSIFLHPWSIAILAVLWLVYSGMFWGFFEQRMPFFTARFFKSMGLGLGMVFVLFGLRFVWSKLVSVHPPELVTLFTDNTAGLGMLWIFLSGVAFGPRKQVERPVLK